MSLGEISNEHLKTINFSWDFAVDPEHSLETVSEEKIERFANGLNEFRDAQIVDEPLTVLRKFEPLRNGKITFGCYLLFHKDPTLLSTIEVGRFDTDTIIRDGITIRNDLFTEVDECLSFMKKHIEKRYVFHGAPKREEVWEYPLEAIREIVIVAVPQLDRRLETSYK
jgi:ATP-dependent DNA helicase RecG